MAYEFINADNKRLEARRLAEDEHAKAFFDLIAEPNPANLPARQATVDYFAARIKNLASSEEQRLEEIDAILNPPTPTPEPEPKTFLQRLRR